jgi:butyryl-CoA dehydrogenase
MEIYAMESSLLRAEKIRTTKGEPAGKQPIALTQYYVSRAFERVELSSRKAIAAAAEGDMLRTQMAILRRLTKHDPIDTIAVGHQIARHVVDAGRYAL